MGRKGIAMSDVIFMRDRVTIDGDEVQINVTGTAVKRIAVCRGNQTAFFDMDRMRDWFDTVRCKDCKHWYNDADTGMACEFTNMGQPPYGYCNWGERKEP